MLLLRKIIDGDKLNLFLGSSMRELKKKKKKSVRKNLLFYFFFSFCITRGLNNLIRYFS